MMNRYLAFIETHPALVSLILIPLVMSAVNAALRPRTPEEYAAMPKRLAAFLKLLRAIFPDPQKAAIAASQLVRGAAMPPAVKRTMEQDSQPEEAKTIPVPPKDPQ